MITKETVQNLIAKYAGNAKNTGSPEAQVAILTERINDLAPHFEKNKKDYSSMRGMFRMIGRRRSLLQYLAKHNESSYKNLIKELGLRK